LLHEDVRDDVLRVVLADALARERIQGLHHFKHGLELAFFELHAAHDLCKVAVTQLIDVSRDKNPGLVQPGGVCRQLLQLQL
jgi:hypothetical protein